MHILSIICIYVNITGFVFFGFNSIFIYSSKHYYAENSFI